MVKPTDSNKNLEKCTKNVSKSTNVDIETKTCMNYSLKEKILEKQGKTTLNVPHPFLKWAGGKRQLIPQINQYLPKKFNKFIEPFVGGGALFFYLLPQKAILIDNNEELINCYKIIKNNVSELIDSLKNHKNEKDYFYEIRNIDRNPEEFNRLSGVERASRTIFLNRCCYNGLYRVNSKGEFNVPFGKYKNPIFCDEKNLKIVNNALKNAEIYKDSFERCLEFAKKDDFIYFDPPYHPLSDTANFTGYTKDSFGKESQIKLFDLFKRLDELGCKLMLSNSYDDFILKLYKDYEIITLYAKRAINSKAEKRGKIKEVLVLNQY